jgi:hypothetical protein
MTNATYTDYPFTANGINFISRVVNESPMGKTISRLPEIVFAEMNIKAVSEIIGDASLLTHDELVSELERINAGGSQAFILLDERSN